MDVRFDNSSVFTIAGPSASGKTVFVEKLIKHRDLLFKNKVRKIHWFYGIVPPTENSDIILHQGLDTDFSKLIKAHDMLVIDDLFVEASSNKEVTNAFTRLAHHKPCTLIYITQNIFHKSADSRTRNLNTHYLVFMKNPRDATQISYISRQMFPKKSQFLIDVYNHVTENEPHSYILLDFKQSTPSYMRVRSHIFPGEASATYINNL